MSRDLDRDPRIDPAPGDKVRVDFEDGDIEERLVIGITRMPDSLVVQYQVDNDSKHIRSTRIAAWRELADDSAVVARGDR